MNMIQVVIGSALGCLIGQAVAAAARQLFVSRATTGVRAELDKVVPIGWLRSSARYAMPVCASAAVIVLGIWAVGDYMTSHAANAAAPFEPPVAAAPEPQPPGDAAPDSAAHDAGADQAPESAAAKKDPYADPEFKVHRRGTTLKDKLLQHAEAKAGNELLRDMKRHAQRSQYDCEAAVQAERYLKTGLDVWGFGAWHSKYFPQAGYGGSTLEQCRGIKDLVEPAALNLSAAATRGNER
jgi:hypothetical protein